MKRTTLKMASFLDFLKSNFSIKTAAIYYSRVLAYSKGFKPLELVSRSKSYIRQITSSLRLFKSFEALENGRLKTHSNGTYTVKFESLYSSVANGFTYYIAKVTNSLYVAFTKGRLVHLSSELSDLKDLLNIDKMHKINSAFSTKNIQFINA